MHCKWGRMDLTAGASAQALLEVEHAKQLLELERSYLEQKSALEARHRQELKTLDGEQTLLAERLFSLGQQTSAQPGLITSGAQQCHPAQQLYLTGRDQSQELLCETPAAAHEKAAHPFRPAFQGNLLGQVLGNKGSSNSDAASPSPRLGEDAEDALAFGAKQHTPQTSKSVPEANEAPPSQQERAKSPKRHDVPVSLSAAERSADNSFKENSFLEEDVQLFAAQCQGLEQAGVSCTKRASAGDCPKQQQPITVGTEDTYYVVSRPLCRTHSRKGDPT